MATAEERKYKVIGTRPIRHDGVDKVTGRAKYGADVKLSGMIYGSILRSPHAHARIVRIDTSKAEALPGVRAVVTGADLPEQGDRVVELGEGAVNMRHLSSNVLAHKKVLYKGHAVAAVAADSPHIAEEALNLIEVEYEPLPAVLDVRQAMQDSAPILNDDVRTQSLGSHPPAEESKPTNIAKHFLFQKGDVEEGFQKADVVVEHEFDTATVHQGYIEPHNATAHWNADGKVTVWMSTQGSFTARQQTAELLRIPVSDVKVVPMEIGGGFGGKISVYLPPVAAALSQKAGRPVKVVMSRANVFEATGPTPGSVMRVKLGATKDGKLVAGDAWLAFEAGAYPGSPIGPGCMCVFACYDIPHARVEGFDVCVNKPRTNAYRAPGSTQVAFATESLIDELARQLDIDPAEFRLKNAAKEGTRRVDGPVFSRVGMVETVEAIRDSEHYQTPLEGKNRGRGMASGFWFNAGLKSTVSATVNLNGTVSLVEGSPDIGGTRTSIAMQLAETLGIRAEDVNPSVADTDTAGYCDVTGGSRVTFSTGIAAVEAAKDIQRQMVERAALLWDVDPAKVRYEDGSIIGPDRKVADLQRTRGQDPCDGRGDHRPGNLQCRDPKRSLRHALRRSGSRSRHRQGADPPLHHRPRCGDRDSSELRRRPNARRRGAGHRLGFERGILVRRPRGDAERDLSRLPHAHLLRRPDDRHDSGRSARPQPPLRRAGRRRSPHRPAARRDRQCHRPSRGRSAPPSAHVPAPRP